MNPLQPITNPLSDWEIAKRMRACKSEAEIRREMMKIKCEENPFSTIPPGALVKLNPRIVK